MKTKALKYFRQIVNIIFNRERLSTTLVTSRTSNVSAIKKRRLPETKTFVAWQIELHIFSVSFAIVKIYFFCFNSVSEKFDLNREKKSVKLWLSCAGLAFLQALSFPGI